MSNNIHKEIYRKNKETGQWERVGSPIGTVVFTGDTLNDTNVNVTDPHYSQSGETVDLSTALGKIAERLDKHDGNISYLAEHGGGGGGGGGSVGAFAIEVTNITPIDGYYYSSSSSLTVDFRITGGTSSMVYQYRVLYDGSYLTGSGYKTIKNRDIVSIKIDNINQFTTQAPHIFMIDAIDPYGFGIETYTLKISETSISIKANTSEILNISDNGKINVTVTNKVVNTDTSIIIDNLTIPLETPYVYSYKSKSALPTEIPIYLIGNVISPSGVKTGQEYTLTMYAQTITGGQAITSDKIYTKVSFVGGDQIAVVFDGISTKTEYEGGSKVTFATGESLLFSYSLFYGDSTNTRTPIYYAVKLDNPTNERFRSENPYGKLLAGKYFDENLHTEDAESCLDNGYTTNGVLKGIAWPIPNNAMYKETEGWVITVRGWVESTKYYDSIAMTDFIEGNSEKFATQIPDRDVSVGKDTLFAQWGCVNIPVSEKETVWNSYTEQYSYINKIYEGIPSVPMHIYDTNGVVNGFFNEPLPYLRFQNSAYGKIDISKYSQEIDSLTRFGNGGFSISMTFRSDVHPFSNRTIMFMGDNTIEGELSEGIKIDLEDVYWVIISNDKKHTLHTKISQNTLNTVVFNLSPKADGSANVKIIVNGVVNASENISSYDRNLSKSIYLGCNFINDTITNFSDVNIYDFKIFTKSLNDLQVSVNSKNSKIGNMSWTEDVKKDYDNWKKRNFIYTDEFAPEEPLSKIFANGEYKSPDFTTLTGSTPPLPIMLLEAPVESDFTKDFFYKVYEGTSVTSTTIHNFTFYYYDPEYNKSVTTTDVGVSLQGTSTLTYKDKNLELYFERKIDEALGKTEMFQPKPSWMPENRFTLKADVVDSAHVNNATIGKWVNNLPIMDENPAMLALKENRPKDVYTDQDGNVVTAQTYDEEKQAYVDIEHTEERIRHTLEGFPFILMVKFAKESSATMLGIYSFNMGRYSHYNMGFKFLKSFTRRNSGTTYEDYGCPSIVSEYETRNDEIVWSGGRIDQGKVYSFELNSDGDDNTNEHPTWSQDDLSVLKHIGEFKYPDESQITDSVWTSLQGLFTNTAKILQKYPYEWKDGTYVKKSDSRYQYDRTDIEKLCVKLAIKNAIGYFVTAIGLGMLDSLGKNMTIRTWDGGNTWWTAFYDMDTGLKLTNAGDEDVDADVYIDIFKNKAKYTFVDESGVTRTVYRYDEIPFDPETKTRVPYTETWSKEDGPNTIETYFNLRPDEGKGYGAYNSGLWNILRDENTFIQETKQSGQYKYYADTWTELRSTILKSENDFVRLIEEQMGECGEMIYNFDYNEKYISDYSSPSISVKGDISMLHGTRVETIRDWLKNRFIFLDGILPSTITIESSLPYYKNGTFYYEGSGGNDEFSINVSSPVILMMNTGQGTTNYKYFLKPYTENRVIMPYIGETTEKATNINATSIITKISGLVGCRFQKFGNNITLPSMSEFNIKNTTTLSNNPILFETVFTKENEKGDKVSELRSIDLSSTKSVGEYTADLQYCNKISDINISNSNITSLQLPSVPLKSLAVNGSLINAITLSNQPNLKVLNLAGCSRLNSITINSCDKLTSINLSNIPNIRSLNIFACPNISEIICANNNTLTSVTIGNMSKLGKIDISGCNNASLKLSIYDVPSLKEFYINDTSFGTFEMRTPSDLSGVTAFRMENCTNLYGIDYGEGVLQYEGSNVLDISPFSSLTAENFLFAKTSFEYLKISNRLIMGDNYFNGNYNIKRIFGDIAINGINVFRNCSGFSLGKEKTEDEKWNTTLSFSTENASNAFEATNCTIEDVYYALKADGTENLVYISGMFKDCHNISTNALEGNIFDNLENVKNMDELFMSCDNITGMLDNGTLSHLLNVERFVRVFPNTISIDSGFFCTLYNGSKLRIKSIENFSPLYNGNGLFSNELFRNLPLLEELNNSFNGSSLYFVIDNEGGGECCTLFKYNTKLLRVENSFNNLVDCGINDDRGIFNFFGGDEWSRGRTDIFPQGLQYFINSVSLKPSKSTSEETYVMSPIPWLIDNNFFSKIKDSIVCFGTSDNNSRYTPDYSSMYKFDKYYLYNEEKENFGFPSKIFEGCVKMKVCNSLCNSLHCVDSVEYDEYGEELISHVPEENEVIKLPIEGMFDDCSSLTELPYMFADMKGMRYVLNPFQFSSTKIANISHIFSDNNSVRMGNIPYGLFFSGYNGKGDINRNITNMENCLSGSKGTHMEAYSSEWVFDGQYRRSDGTYEYLLNPNTEYKASDESSCKYLWNKYVGDGNNVRIAELYDELSGVTFTDGGVEHHLVDALPEELENGYIDQEYAKNTFLGKYISLTEDLSDRLRERRYFCSPDIFLYCKNGYNTLISRAFENSGYYDSGITRMQGIYGTICPYIFEPVTKIGYLEGLFKGCMYLFPYKWDNEGVLVDGTLHFGGIAVNENLLSNLTDIYSVRELFSNTTIWGGTSVPEKLYWNQGKAYNLSALYNGCEWIWIDKYVIEGVEYAIDGYAYPQLSKNAFKYNKEVRNVEFFLSGTKSKIFIDRMMFNNVDNPFIDNCSSFLNSSTNVYGTVPEFWTFDSYRDKGMGYSRAYYSVNPVHIDNYDEIPDDFKK